MNSVLIANKRKISLKITALFSLSLLWFYFLNLYTGIAHDDYLFKFIVNSNKLADTRVESIQDIIRSMYNHYLVTNGRILLNGLAQLFLIPDNKLWFNIANTLVFGLFQFLLLKRLTALKTSSVYQYLVLLLFLWFLIPVPNQTLLWLDGSMNYLWGITIVLLFLDFFDKLNLKKVQVNNKYLPLIFVFGFIAGFTHEVITIGISVALIISVLRKFRKYRISSLILIFGFLLGTLLMVISPGNMNRLMYSGLESAAIFDVIIQRCIRFIYFILSANAFWILMILFLILYVKDRKRLKEVYRKQQLLIQSVFISLGFIFLAGSSSHRAFFGVSVFSIIIIISIVYSYSKVFLSNISKIVYVILSVVAIIEFTQVTSELRANMIVFEKDEANWLKSDENVFELRVKNRNRFAIHDDPSDKYYGQNSRLMNLYYGKDFMMFIPKELYENVYKSNKFLDDKRLVSNISLKKSSKAIKLYKTEKQDFLIHRVSDSISKRISDRPQVEYKSNKVFEIKNSDYISSLKSIFLKANHETAISSEMAECFVLPTSHGNYLILNSPSVIPFENLEEILIYPSKNDTIPILSF